MRVVHAPVNTAGIPWQNVQALRRRGIDARLVVFERYRLHPEADWSLDRSGSFARRQLQQWRALLRLLPRTDVFHFYFGLTLVPQSLQFPLLRALRKKSVMHYLGSDIRGKRPEELAAGAKAGAQVVGSYDAIRWVPDAEVIPPGIDVARDRARAAERPRPAADRPRAVLAPAQGHRARDRGRRGARRRPRARRGPAPRRGLRALPRRGRGRRPAERRLVRRLRDRGDGAREAGRDLPPRRGGAAHRAGLRHARPARLRDRGDAPRGAPAARRGRGVAPAGRRREPRLRRARARPRAGRRPPARLYARL